MLCTVCIHGTTDTWKCESCGETHCRHMMWKCPSCNEPKPGVVNSGDEVSMILAVHKGTVVGAISAMDYRGADHSWPFGWKELQDKVQHFDLIDSEVPIEQAKAMVAAHEPDKRLDTFQTNRTNT